MLLRVQDQTRDVLRLIVGDVVPQNKGQGLALAQLDSGHDAVALGAILLGLLEHDERTAGMISGVDDQVQLKLDILAAEGSRLALTAGRPPGCLQQGRLVRLKPVAEGGEYVDVLSHTQAHTHIVSSSRPTGSQDKHPNS